MNDLVNLATGSAAVIGLMGYLVVFIGLILLMIVILIMGKIMVSRSAKQKTAVAEAGPESKAVPLPQADPAPGSAGELKLYDTDSKDAAMIMAIVADNLGKPLNELRFKSIREVK